MSFLNSIVSFGKQALGFVASDTLGGSIARTAILGFATKKINDMVNKQSDQSTQPLRDMGTREQVDPDTEHAVPVVYGTAFVEGMITDAVLSADKQTMFYCVTLCEKTGALINGTDSVISFDQVFWNGNRVEFAPDGVTVSGMVSDDGDVVINYTDRVKFFPFNNGSDAATNFTTQANGNTAPAYTVFPNWTPSHSMDQLVFCLVRVQYDGANRVTGLGNLRFRLSNTMRRPGDVLNDYMTNTRYGAGIPPEEMNT